MGCPRDVLGQSGTGRSIVPLSRDKKISLSCCPFVPGQEEQQKSQDKITLPKIKKMEKRRSKTRKVVLKQEKDILKQK